MSRLEWRHGAIRGGPRRPAGRRWMDLLCALCVAWAGFTGPSVHAQEAATGPCGRASAEIEGTAWRLDPGGWTPAECAAIDTLVDRLPTGWRTPKRPVVVRRGPAPALRDDLWAPHTLAVADVRRHSITLGLDGLDARIDAWTAADPGRRSRDRTDLARDLIQRQYVHALAHLVDHRERLSRRDGWVRLGWSRAMRRYVAAERHPAAFVNDHGRVSPLEDLATVAEAYFVPEAFPTPIVDLAPRCRMPSKWRYMPAFSAM